mmetsp:Transcript_17723/g.25570  ORF Transcript_17723/g.25570 Transcript_17723/m.25570 type:complete len:643 (+) Transcript_17723:39-1967(+)
MGASASISAAMKSKRLSKDQIAASATASPILSFFNFNDYADDKGTISLEEIMHIFSQKTDVFLTHDWGINQFNHKRVARVNKALQSRGITTWFDDEQMEGDIKSKMTSGIDQSRVVVTFITSRYMKKVAGTNAEDNCRLEFGYACRRKTGARMLPVVMEPEMRDTSQWEGQVGLVLGGSLYVDLCDEEGFDAKIDDIVNRVSKIMGPPLKKIIESINWGELHLDSNAISVGSSASPQKSVPAPAASPAAAASPTTTSSAVPDELFTALVNWFVKEVKVVPKVAEKYSHLLIEAEVGTIDRLKKKLNKNQNFLLEKGFDEDDSDDIIKAMFGESHAVAVPVAVAVKAPVHEEEVAKVTAHNYDQYKTLTGHSGAVKIIIQLQDYRICSGGDNDLRVWRLDGTCEQVLRGHTNSVVAVYQMNDGLVCSASLDKTIRVWNLRTGSNIMTFAGHDDSVFTLCALPDGRLVSGSADKTLRVWNLSTQKCEMVIKGHTNCVQFAILLWDGTICTASWDKTLRTFNVQTGNTINVFKGHTDKLVHVNQLADGRICSCSVDTTIRIWDVKTAACERVLTGHTSNSRWTVQIMNGQLVSGSKDQTIRFWNVNTGATEKILTGHTDYIRCLLLLNDDRVVSGSDDTTMRIWG